MVKIQEPLKTKVENWNGNEIRFVLLEDKGERYAVGKDVAIALGYKNTQDALYKHVEKQDKIRGVHVTTTSGKKKMTIISKRGVKTLITGSRLPNSVELANKLGIEVLNPYKEQNTLNYIMGVFNQEKMIRQYSISNEKYRIDLYFPRYNLAIECDENGHTDRSINYDIDRQNYIENKIGCHFIRYNSDSLNFDINNVCNEIRQFILKSFIRNMKK